MPDSLHLPAAPSAAYRNFERLVLALLCFITAFAAVPYGTVQPWTESFVVAALFAAGGLWFLGGVWRADVWFLKEYKLLIPLLLMAAYMFFQTLPLRSDGAISYDQYGTKTALLRLLAYTFTLGALLCHARTKRRLYALLGLVLGLALLCAVFGLMRQALQKEEMGFILPLLPRNGGYAQFINKNHFATLALMGLGLLWGLLAGRGLGREKWLVLLAAALPLVIAVIVSASRSGILAAIAQLPFAVLLAGAIQPQDSRRKPAGLLRIAGSVAGKALLIIALLAGGLVTVVLVGGEDIVSRFEKIQNESAAQKLDDSNANRANVWKSTWQLFKAHPVTGVGLGGFWIAVSTVHEGSGRLVPQQAHNDYLEILASGGVIGALIFAAFIAVFIRAARPQLRSPDAFRRAVCLGALAGLFGVALQSLVEFGLHITFNALICVILAALATIRLRPQDA
jgi:O-antigen ligase